MTEPERSDLRRAIDLAKTELRKTEKELTSYPHYGSDADFNFLIQKARKLKEAIDGFQKQLDEP